MTATHRDADTPAELPGRGVLSTHRRRRRVGGAPMGAGLAELGALLGGAGARAALDEKQAEVVRRQTVEPG